jgi:hypothetical protein
MYAVHRFAWTLAVLFASEVEWLIRCTRAQASGALQAGRREHARSRALHGLPEGGPPRSLASGLSLQQTTYQTKEVYIERLRCNETLRRIVCALSLERYGHPYALFR